MKQKRKKIIQAVCAVVFSVCCIVGASTMFSDEEKSPFTVQAIENVETLAVTTTPEYFSDYGIGETLAINNFETLVDGERTTLYAVLQKDYKVFASLTPEIEQTTYQFTETGVYNLVYYSVSESGEKIIVRNLRFTVETQPYIDIVFAPKYMVNSTVSMQAECVLGNKKTSANVSVKSPTGKDVELVDLAAELTECGKYAVAYTANMEGTSVSRVYYVTVTGSSDLYSDYIRNVSGVSNAENDVQAPEWAISGTGVRVTGESFASFRYANIVDVDTLSKEENIVNLLPLGTDGYSTLSKIMVRLIDVYDASNEVAYEFTYVKTSDRHTYCKIMYKDVERALKEPQKGEGFYEGNQMYGLGAGGVYFDVERHGLVDGEYGNLKWLRMQMDHHERKFFLTGGKTGAADVQNEVLDLDNPTHVGYGNEWSGFTTGEVYIQIELTGKGSQTGCIVQEIAGEKLYGARKSTKGPELLFEEEVNGELPTGVVGKYYKFPTVQYSVDAMDGKNLKPAYQILSLEKVVLGQSSIALKPDTMQGFTPQEVGTYLLTYQVKDREGNVGTRKVPFKVMESLGEKGLSYDCAMSDDLKVGTYFTVPKLIPVGLSYIVARQESISYNGTEYANRSGEKVFLDKVGEIKVKVSYEDYLGECYEFEQIYAVTFSEEAITELQGAIPKYVLKGRSITLPKMTAIDYSAGASSKDYYPAWKLSVDGKEVDVNERTVSVTKNDGEEMNVVYSINGKTVYAGTMRVVEAKYLSDRFFVTSGEMEISDSAQGVMLSASADASADIINPLVVDDFVTNLPITLAIAEEKANFDHVDVYFEDYLYSNICVFVRITRGKDGKLYGQVNGEGEVLLLPSSTRYTGQTMTYNAVLNCFEFTSRLVIKKDVNGEKFNGFPSNRINVSLQMSGVSGETQICVAELGLFGMAAQYDEKGVLQAYEDRVIPSIVSETSFRDNSFAFGSTAYFPAIEARTALSGLTTATISVISPSGKTLIREQNAYNDYSVKIEEYGLYKVVYTVPFLKGEQRFNYMVRVFKDELPEVALNTPLKDTYKVNEELVIPEILLNGTGKNTTVQCYLMKPNTSLVSVKAGDKVKLEELGNYTLQAIVKDEFNATFKTWTFIVEA